MADTTNLNPFPLSPQRQLKAVVTMTRDQAGGLWLCDRDEGVFRLTNTNLTLMMTNVPNRILLSSHTDSAGQVWLGDNTGLIYRFEAGTWRRHVYRQRGTIRSMLPVILSDHTGQTWFVTMNSISCTYEGGFRVLTAKDGLPGHDYEAFLEDNEGYFWLGGGNQIFRIAPDELEKHFSTPSVPLVYTTFGFDDGLRGFIRQGAHGTPANGYPGYGYPIAVKSTDGRLWFSTSAGLAMIDPAHLPHNSIPPAVHIQEVVVADKKYKPATEMKFTCGTKNIEFDYVALSFVHAGKIQYRYRLDGYDAKWIEAGSRRQAFYSNLKAMTYQFHVTAANDDGVWNETGDALKFSIQPMIYETTWFPFFCGIIFLTAGFGLYRWRIARRKAMQALHARLARATQMASFAELSVSIAHEISQPLTAVITNANASLRWLNRETPKIEEARETIQSIIRDGNRGAEVVNRIRALLKNEPLLRAKVNVNDLVNEIVNLTQRDLHETLLTMELAKDLPPVSADRIQLQQVVLNLIMNAIDAMRPVQDRPRKLRIETELQGQEMVLVRVIDSGIGVNPDTLEQLFETFFTTKSKGLGLGLSISRTIIESHGGRLWAEKNRGPGATFQFIVPIAAGGDL